MTEIDAVRCPWCSADVPDPAAVTCSSCGAVLQERAPDDLPGVTQVDAAGVVQQVKSRRSSVRALIGMTDEETEGSPATAMVEPPSEEVRLEMLRLKIDALEAELQAQRAALEAARAAEAAAAVLPVQSPVQPPEEPAGDTLPLEADRPA